ncbi:MAG: Efflux ABC transporter, ATP-binding protein [uncultured Corynebacteriales bacterium]|uniref:Efflux ABC transporter, ATP-binding protein n=1 Tax=uncultured Mycobacteriales bacterium TaxID=581187 RepID=A0A6J4K0F8_9ACTN|nr:MAG: Efflux ABC transporter, ATP-binding protein [uncultured Corynebacteriales bacterium]
MLEVDGLTKRYGDTLALSSLTFAVRPGEVFGFVGANGAGKTTAMRIMLGVLAADAGEVRWQGRPVTFETRRRFGYMPEERGLYPKMRVGEHLVYLARLHGLDAAAATRAAEALTERLGVATRRDDAVEKLSLGNQQRVQLAAALVHDPEVLVLDEPFSGLDPVGVDALAGVLLERAKRGVPVVFSSHQLDLVERLCDSVGIINAGRLVASGTVAELRERETTRQLRVVVPDVPATWAGTLPGVTVVSERRGEVVLELGPGVDDQQVLAAAARAGRVEHFSRRRPTLTELFREAVADVPADRVEVTA